MNDTNIHFPVEEHRRCADEIRRGAVSVVNILERWLDARSVLDLGCGTGIWLRVFSDGGRREVFGVDCEPVGATDLVIAHDQFLVADLGQKLDLHRRFDLVLCLEVAEHLNAWCADMVVENCVRHGDVIVFSAAIPGQQGIQHLNEQPPQYWTEKFRRHGYVVLDVIRPQIWDDSQIPVWYRQNMLLIVAEDSPQLAALRANAGPGRGGPLALAHPEYLRMFSGMAQAGTVETETLRQRLTQVHGEFETALIAVIHQRDDETQARSTAEAGLSEATAARDAALRQSEADTAQRVAADQALDAIRVSLEAEVPARQAAESALAEATSARELEAAARVAAEQARIELGRALDAEAAARAVAEASCTDALRERDAEAAARVAAEQAHIELGRALAAEAAARGVADASCTDALRERDAESAARIAAEQALVEVRRRRDIEAAARVALEASRAAAQRDRDAETAARRGAERALGDVRQSLAAQTAARVLAEAGLADALRRRDGNAAARVAAEAEVASATLRLRTEHEVRIGIETTLAELRRQHTAEALARRNAVAELDGTRLALGAAQEARSAAQRAQDRIGGELAAAQRTQNRISGELAAAQCAQNRISGELAAAQREIAVLHWERQIIVGSTLWRATEPLRRLGRTVSRPSRQRLRTLSGTLLPWLRRSPHPEEALLQQRPWDEVPDPPPILPTVAPAVDASAEPHLAAATPITPPTTSRGMRRIVFVSGEPNTPGHTYRIVRAAEAASRLGLIASWMRIEEAEARGQEISAADVVYIWRAANSPVVTNLLDRARAAGAKVVFDVDDLVFEPKLAEISIIDGIRTLQLTETEVAGLFNLFSQVVTQVDACVATTEALAERLRACNRVTFVLPNGFDDAVLEASRRAVRRRHGATDGLIRLGYAAGTRTHQADFRVAVDAIATLLRERPQCRLVLFRDPAAHTPVLMVDEFSVLAGLEAQIEWRDMVPLGELANEMARFDINLVPLEAGNPFCESKSELKYFESALVEVCTVASATGPMRAAIRDGETGRIADTPAAWHQVLRELVDDPQQRARLARAAYFDVLWRFGPQRRAATLGAILAQLDGDERGAAAFELELRRHKQSAVPRHIDIPPAETVFQSDRDGVAEVTVVVPLYNYAHYIEEALESVRLQSLSPLDLVVVDDASTDDSLAVALAWIRRHAGRFNRIVVLRNHTNAGLARTRNMGFAMAETPFVLPLDADNKLRPDCGARCLAAMHTSQAAFVYPSLQCFGSVDFAIGEAPFTANRLIGGNYIDAMALIAKWAWAAVGGYAHIDNGWEDYDFWCNCVEHGLWGLHVPEILADYRVHPKSMLRTRTDDLTNKLRLIADMERRHTWLHILEV